MKITILPGTMLLLTFKSEGIVYPMITTVKTVQRGSISVDEPKSINGLARIICHASSESLGRYWYEFKDLNLCPHSIDIIEVEAIREPISTIGIFKKSEFIKD